MSLKRSPHSCPHWSPPLSSWPSKGPDPTLCPHLSLKASLLLVRESSPRNKGGGSLSWAPIPPHSAWGQNNLTRGHDYTSHLAFLLARLGRGPRREQDFWTTGLRPQWPRSWLPLHRLHSPFGPPLKTTTLFQGHRNHCPEQPPECSAPLPSLNHHPGPWSCPWFLPLARERVSRHNRWRPVCRGGCPIQEKNQVLFSCFLRFAHVAPPAALPFLLCLPQPPSSPPAADVCGGRGVGRWGAGGAGARSWEDCLGSAGSVFGILWLHPHLAGLPWSSTGPALPYRPQWTCLALFLGTSDPPTWRFREVSTLF